MCVPSFLYPIFSSMWRSWTWPGSVKPVNVWMRREWETLTLDSFPAEVCDEGRVEERMRVSSFQTFQQISLNLTEWGYVSYYILLYFDLGWNCNMETKCLAQDHAGKEMKIQRHESIFLGSLTSFSLLPLSLRRWLFSGSFHWFADWETGCFVPSLTNKNFCC